MMIGLGCLKEASKGTEPVNREPEEEACEMRICCNREG